MTLNFPLHSPMSTGTKPERGLRISVSAATPYPGGILTLKVGTGSRGRSEGHGRGDMNFTRPFLLAVEAKIVVFTKFCL